MLVSREALETNINDALALVSFILRLLLLVNEITVKNRYRFALIASAFGLLQGAVIYTKLSLHNSYHLDRI